MIGAATAFNIERARRVYEGIRDCWVAGGGALEAHDRLALVTVAAEARETAFLTMIEPEHQATVTRVIKEAGLEVRPWTAHFDVELEPGDFEEPDGGVSSATIRAYLAFERESPFSGLCVSSNHKALAATVGMTELGAFLSYPMCCVAMDNRSKTRDHILKLSAMVEREGDDPDQIARGLSEGQEYPRPVNELRYEWDENFRETHKRFPFVVHTACSVCLRTDDSLTALLNARHENLVRAVSTELHLMVRWGSRALVGATR